MSSPFTSIADKDMDQRLNLYVITVTSLMVVSFIWSVKCDTYHIVTSLNSSCQIVPCTTLQMFVANSSTNGSDYITNLIIQPGNHVLQSNFSLINYTNLSMVANQSFNFKQRTVIQCDVNIIMHFYAAVNIYLRGITFVGCVNNIIEATTNFTLQNCTFEARKIVLGTALTLRRTTLYIINSYFSSYTSNGVLKSIQSNLSINVSKFEGNSADSGGVIQTKGGITRIFASEFRNNTAKDSGGVLHTSQCTIWMKNSVFSFNSARISGGVISSAKSSVEIVSSIFLFNAVITNGGVMRLKNSSLYIENSTFQKNMAIEVGGVLSANKASTVKINESSFSHNTAVGGGVVYAIKMIKLSFFGQNNFTNNQAKYGAILYFSNGVIVSNGKLFVTQNTAEMGSIVLLYCRGIIRGVMSLVNNTGSYFLFDSDMSIYGDVSITNNKLITQYANRSFLYQEGGGISSYLSLIKLEGFILLEHNHATNGGGMFIIASRLDIRGRVLIVNNSAVDTGGGSYVFQSEVKLQGYISISDNLALKKGGGIHAVSSSVILDNNQRSNYECNRLIPCYTHFIANHAENGGGLSLEVTSKLYIISLFQVLLFKKNTADYGAAIYVDDYTNTAMCLASSKNQTDTLSTECFLQIFIPIRLSNIKGLPLSGKGRQWNISFSQNLAKGFGSSLYGGLIDRCTLSQVSKINFKLSTKIWLPNSIVDDIASEPVQVCFCKQKQPICGYEPPPVHVMKGRSFKVSIVAIDQVNHTVNATIRTFLSTSNGRLGEGQQVQSTYQMCTALIFNIFSPGDFTDLILYAEGPCKDTGISQRRLKVIFSPCTCPIGFQVSNRDDSECDCVCSENLFPFITDCNKTTSSLIRKSTFWMTFVNDTNEIEFLINPYCPFDFCLPPTPPISINLNILNGADAQCAFGRSGLLCGMCQPHLSLSLASSQCIRCPSYWPALFVVIIVSAFLAGILLVSVFLLLNLTVATGTLNGLIFYVNVVAANHSVLLPFKQPQVPTVFIDWLNLDIGFDVCFFKHMDAYTKMWLQFIFPTYVILLVLIVIFISEHSIRFSRLIGRKNPVATLATLILLSYAKLLHNIIGALSFAVLNYPNGTHEIVWRPDATVKYLRGKHIPLFLAAVVILILGIIYTVLLFSWQWLLKFSHKKFLKWVHNTKLSSFMDAYNAPYCPKYRYWTGLLLFTRALLYLTSSINVSSEPSINLMAVIIVVVFLLFLKGHHLYKIWFINIIEDLFYLNLIIFSVAKFFVLQTEGNHILLAYISTVISVIMFVYIMAYHFIKKTNIIQQIRCQRNSVSSNHGEIHAYLLVGESRQTSKPVTYSEVAINDKDSHLFELQFENNTANK